MSRTISDTTTNIFASWGRNMSVKFYDLNAAQKDAADNIRSAVIAAAESGWYILGPELQRFEERFAEFSDAAHCIGVANGLDAITLALRALGIGPGDEVIVPSFTFIATWL